MSESKGEQNKGDEMSELASGNPVPYVDIDEEPCGTQSDWKHVESHYKNIPKNDNFKTIIINFGTPGSGKSQSTELVKRFATGYFGAIRGWENISHDDYIIKDDRYTTALKDPFVGNKKKRIELGNICDKIRKGIGGDSTDEFIKELWENDRGKGDEFTGDNIINHGTQILVYDKLINSIKDGKNIIYEAMGNKSDTIINMFETIKKYKCEDNADRYFIILTYNSINPVENKKILNDRWRTGIQTINSFKDIKDIPESLYYTLPKPWLYNDDEKLNGLNYEILSNINNIIEKCYNIKNAGGECNGIGPDILVVFDKNKKKHNGKPTSYTIPLSERGTILHKWKRVKRLGQFNIVKKEGKLLKTLITTLNKTAAEKVTGSRVIQEIISATGSENAGHNINKKYIKRQKRKPTRKSTRKPTHKSTRKSTRKSTQYIKKK